MSRGNQREVDRQKAQAKTDAKVKALGRVRLNIGIYICIGFIKQPSLLLNVEARAAI